MHPSELLSALGRKIDIPDLSFDENGLCRLRFQQRYVIDMKVVENGIWLIAFFGPLPADTTSAFLRRLLQAQFMGHDTGGASFSVNPESEELMLSLFCPSGGYDGNTFAEQVGNFVDAVARWSEVEPEREGESNVTPGSSPSSFEPEPAFSPADFMNTMIRI